MCIDDFPRVWYEPRYDDYNYASIEKFINALPKTMTDPKTLSADIEREIEKKDKKDKDNSVQSEKYRTKVLYEDFVLTTFQQHFFSTQMMMMSSEGNGFGLVQKKYGVYIGGEYLDLGSPNLKQNSNGRSDSALKLPCDFYKIELWGGGELLQIERVKDVLGGRENTWLVC